MKFNEETIQMFNNVLNKNKRWPLKYWDDSIGRERAKICTKYLCEKILNWKDNDFEYHITESVFIKCKLGNMIKKVYEGFSRNAVIDAFPEKERIINRQQRKNRIKNEILELMPNPKMFVKESFRKDIIEMVILYLDCEEKEIPHRMHYFSFAEFNLSYELQYHYNNSVFKFIEEVRPNMFKPWEFDQYNYHGFLSQDDFPYSFEVPQGYFDEEENRYEALIWVLKKAQADGKAVREVRTEMVKKYGLFTLMAYYKGSLFSAINEFFEEKNPRPWEFEEEGTTTYWKNNSDLAKEATLFLINKLGLTKENVINLTESDFHENYLGTMLYINYNNLIFNAIDDVFPNEFNDFKWWFNDIPQKAFDIKKNRQEAVQSLVKKLNLTELDVPHYLTKEMLISNNFIYILEDVHRGNMFSVINEAFPNKYNKNDFSISDYVSDYIDSFSTYKYSKIFFSAKNEDDIRKGLTKLSEIFTINTNSWVGRQKKKPFIEDIGDLEALMYDQLVKDNISIYEFEYDEPEDPKNDKEDIIFSRLAQHSKAKYMNVVWLYWRAYNFFKQFNLHLQYESTFMRLGKEDYWQKNDEDEDEDEEYYYMNEDIVCREAETYSPIVRCGELGVYRLYAEIKSDRNPVWIFPFDENIKSQETNKAYLIQFNHDAMVSFYDSMRIDFSRFTL